MDATIELTQDKPSLATSEGSQQLSLSDIKSVAQGACFLASGGGGSLQLSLQKMIPAFFTQHTQITVVALDALTEQENWGSVVAAMGSPLKLFKNPELIKAAIPAFKELAGLCAAFKAAGQPRFSSLELMDFCLPVEQGAVNSIVPMIVANSLSSAITPIVVIDADGAGRAVPILPLTSYARNLALYPNILGGDNETKDGKYFDYASLSVQDETTLEAACLGLIDSEAFGLASGLAIYAANGPEFQSCKPVPNSISDALKIGNIINANTGTARLNGVLNYINKNMGRRAKQVFYGTVSEMKQATESLDSGYVILTGSGDFAEQTLKLFIENENIWAELSAAGSTKPWVLGPDSMNYLSDSGDVFDNSDLWTLYNAGERPTVSIIGIQAASMVRENLPLMQAWTKEVVSKDGPDSYLTPWLS